MTHNCRNISSSHFTEAVDYHQILCIKHQTTTPQKCFPFLSRKSQAVCDILKHSAKVMTQTNINFVLHNFPNRCSDVYILWLKGDFLAFIKTHGFAPSLGTSSSWNKEEKIFSLWRELLKWPPIPWTLIWSVKRSLFPYTLHSQLYHIMPFPFNIHTFHQQFYPIFHSNNISSKSQWSQTADDSHPRSTRPLHSALDRSFRHFQRGGRLLAADRSCLGLDGEPPEKLQQSQLHFWNKKWTGSSLG